MSDNSPANDFNVHPETLACNRPTSGVIRDCRKASAPRWVRNDDVEAVPLRISNDIPADRFVFAVWVLPKKHRGSFAGNQLIEFRKISSIFTGTFAARLAELQPGWPDLVFADTEGGFLWPDDPSTSLVHRAKEFRARHECVKNIHSENLIRAPRYPHSSLEIIRRLSAAIKLTENPSGTLHEVKLAKLIGIPKSTFNDWGHRYQTEQIRRFLSGVERLPEADRVNFLSSLCRHCPRLEDPRISHDKQAVSLVKSLILSGPGVSLITGSNWARNYLLGAIGNSFAAYLPIAGFDAFPPVDLVPVPGVSYPTRKVSTESLSSLFEEAWPGIERAKDSLILLNRVWERIVSRHRDVLKLAAKNHLVVAGDFPSVPATIRGTRSINVIHVESIRGNSGAKLRIRIGIR